MTNQIAIAGSQDGALQIISDPSSFWLYRKWFIYVYKLKIYLERIISNKIDIEEILKLFNNIFINYYKYIPNQFGCLRVSCIVFTTLDIELII